MKEAHIRYESINAEQYEEKTIVSRLIGAKSKKIIGNYLSEIKNKKILEIGCGSGLYTRLFYKNNYVKCIDLHPHLFTIPDLLVIEGSCTKLDSLLNPDEKFDLIIGIWMTEYINEQGIFETLQQSEKFLSENGQLLITFISKGLWGRCYIAGAKVKGFTKYFYSNNTIKDFCTKSGLQILQYKSISRFGFEYGKFYIISKIKNPKPKTL